MVKVKDFGRFMDDVAETFGFLFAQEIASNPRTPKDTSNMARSFPATFQYDRQTKKISFSTPFYTKHVMEGTRFMEARPFVLQIFHQKGNDILKQAFKIVDKRYS